MTLSNINLESINLDGLTEQEKSAVLQILKEYSEDGTSKTFNDLQWADWDEIPVDIDTFLHKKEYLGNALYDADGVFTVFPYWEEKLKEIFPTNTTTRYNTIVLTGAIGLGKSTIAVICLLYLLYRLLCLKDPYLYYGMQPIDKLSISLMNITIENAKGVALDKMNQMILASDWFLSHGEMAGISNLEYRPNKHIELITASSNNQVIGRAIFANFTDEVNFGLTNDVEKLKKKQKQLISQIDARMKSRFMRGTYLPTLNIIASSKNSDQSFLEDYIENKRKNESKTTLIVDEPQWIVDSRKDSDEHFFVGIGNKFLANELLPLNPPKDLIDEYRARGYSILEVPMGYYESFLDNIDGALTDIAGIATASSLKYISGIRWNEIKTDTYKNPFIKEIIEVGNGPDDLTQYSDFFDLTRITPQLRSRPLFIHLDMSMSGDKTGIAGVYIAGKRPKVEGEDSSKEMFYRVAFNVSIKAPKGYEISFDKNRAFIRWLRQQGFRIKGISADTFQSAQLAQQLQADGFDFKSISVDRLDGETKTQLQYAYLKSTIYDKRLLVYKDCDFLTEEVLGLERESDGHIQHPEQGTQGCFTPETKVRLVDGRSLSFLDLEKEYLEGKENWVYSFNEDKKIIEPKRIVKAWCTLKDQPLVRITLDNGEWVECTLNHRFMLRDGTYKEAKDLVENDSLMPLYTKYPNELIAMHNYRMYYEPIEDAWHYEHRRFATEIDDEKYLVHHKDCNPDNNCPPNLIWCSKSRHQKIHAELSTGSHSPEAKAKRSASLSQWYANNPERAKEKNHKAWVTQKGLTEEEWLEQHQQQEEKKRKQKEHAEELQQTAEVNKAARLAYISAIEQMFNVVWTELSNNERGSYAVKYQRALHPETQEQISAAVSKNHADGKYENAYIALGKCNEESKKLKELIPTIDPDKFEQIFGFKYETVPRASKAAYTVKYRRIVGKEILNHKVVKVEFIDKRSDVYDIEVEDNHNFALDCGVFVHNSKDRIDAICGALWNANLHADEYSYDIGEDLELFMRYTEEADKRVTSKEDFLREFEASLGAINVTNKAPTNKGVYYSSLMGDDFVII